MFHVYALKLNGDCILKILRKLRKVKSVKKYRLQREKMYNKLFLQSVMAEFDLV